MNYDKLLLLGIELGSTLMSSGAEIYRVEESISRLITAYGQEPQTFVLPSCIFLSITTPDGPPMSQMRRIPAHGTDIELLEQCNDLCRHLCAQVPDVEEALECVRGLTTTRKVHPSWFTVLAHVVSGGFFCLFFGGAFRDFLCAALCGLAVGLLSLYSLPLIDDHVFLRTLVCSAAVSAIAIISVYLGLGLNVEKITIGALMLLVPGMALTNAMREIMAGDIFSGVHRTAEVILVAAAIALGSAVPLILMRGL